MNTSNPNATGPDFSGEMTKYALYYVYIAAAVFVSAYLHVCIKVIINNYSKPRISRIQVDRQNYPSHAKIRHKRSDIKGLGTIVPEIVSEICEDPTYTRFTVCRLRVSRTPVDRRKSSIYAKIRLS